ncbi:unnamed protein product [Calypogeia fissa]
MYGGNAGSTLECSSDSLELKWLVFKSAGPQQQGQQTQSTLRQARELANAGRKGTHGKREETLLHDWQKGLSINKSRFPFCGRATVHNHNMAMYTVIGSFGLTRSYPRVLV